MSSIGMSRAEAERIVLAVRSAKQRDERKRRNLATRRRKEKNSKRRGFASDLPLGTTPRDSDLDRLNQMYKQAGIVQGTELKARTVDADILQAARAIEAERWEHERNMRELARCTSDQPVEYETLPPGMKGGIHDCTYPWWKQAVPDFRAPPRSAKKAIVSSAFLETRKKNKGIQAPRHS